MSVKTKREVHDISRLSNISDLRPKNNFVLCRRLKNNLTDTTPAGIQKASIYYHRDQYLPGNVERVFEVTALPDKLTEQFGRWKTDIEVSVGDIIIVSYFDSLNSKVILTKSDEYRFIQYYGIIAVIKSFNEISKENHPYVMNHGEIFPNIKPVNGYLLFTTLFEEIKTSLILAQKHIDPRIGLVEHIGTANKYYTKGEKDYYDKGIEVKKGDKIVFKDIYNRFAPPLENELHQVLDKRYFYCHRFRLGGKLKN
jgi:co-chaperonin GroES (HSP10)